MSFRKISTPCDIALRRLGGFRLVYGLDAVENLAEIALRDLNIIVGLQIQPKLRRCAERLGEPKRGISRNAGLLAGDPLDSRPRQAADLGKSACRHFERNEKLLPQNLAGMHGLQLLGHRTVLLVVVHDLDLRRAFRGPNKAYPELIVDADRVLPLAIARERLKAVARRRPQIAEIARGVEVAQFPARHLDQIGRKALRTFAVEDGFGGLVPEAPDHRQCVSFNDTRQQPPVNMPVVVVFTHTNLTMQKESQYYCR
jgi:hypothetical protein